ncbi:hypothetical protein D3C75_626010 [compost metagenome]
MRRIQQVPETVPVVDVHQPVHQVGLIVAVSGLQLGIQRVFSGTVFAVQRAWILIRLSELGGISRRTVRVVIAHCRLLLHAIPFINRDNVLLHVVPGGLELAPVTCMIAIQHFQPHPIAVCLRGSHMSIIGRFAEQGLHRMIRNAFSREIAVRRVFQLAVHLQKPCLFD